MSPTDSVGIGVADLELALDLSLQLAHALNLASDLEQVLADTLALAGHRDIALVHARDLARHLVHDLNFHLGRVRSFESIALNRSRSRAQSLVHVIDLACSLEDLGLERNRARELLNTLDLGRVRIATSQDQDEERAGLTLAGRLLTAATWPLPVPDRARYAEEYQSELAELARSGAGRGQQLGYGFRQLLHAFRTGRALRSTQ